MPSFGTLYCSIKSKYQMVSHLLHSIYTRQVQVRDVFLEKGCKNSSICPVYSRMSLTFYLFSRVLDKVTRQIFARCLLVFFCDFTTKTKVNLQIWEWLNILVFKSNLPTPIPSSAVLYPCMPVSCTAHIHTFY
jgi:hypothetical protein